MEIAIVVIVLGVLLFGYFVFSNERRKRKSGDAPKPKKEKKVKEKKVKEPKQKKEKMDTDTMPNYESLQTFGSGNASDQQGQDSGSQYGGATARDSFTAGRGDGYLRREMDQLFEKENRAGSRSSSTPFLSTSSNNDDSYASTRPRDQSSGDQSKGRSIRDVKYNRGAAQNFSPNSVGEELGYDISDFEGKNETEISRMLSELPPQIRLMLITNIFNRLYD